MSSTLTELTSCAAFRFNNSCPFVIRPVIFMHLKAHDLPNSLRKSLSLNPSKKQKQQRAIQVFDIRGIYVDRSELRSLLGTAPCGAVKLNVV